MPSNASDADAVRARVADQYTRAARSEPSPCCADTCCGGATAPKGVAAALAGYDAGALADLPADAVTNSFGCGDPLAFADVQPGETVLDLGCGAGIDLLLAARAVGPAGTVIGVDMTDEMVERARANAADAGAANVEVRRGIIEQLPVADGEVSWVISNCVINLSPEKPRVFAEIARVLAPGGRFSISDIVVDDLPEWLRARDALHGRCIAGAIDEAAYLAGLRDAGLTAEVDRRTVFDGAQLAAMLDSECFDEVAALESLGADRLEAAVKEMAGRVASVRLIGAKA